MANMKIIGITGIIGSGKSTVAGFLQELGAEVIHADIIGHQVYEPGTPGWSRLIALFGDAILNASGHIDRQKLGHLVFQDAEARAKLNAVTHPLITGAVREQIAALRRHKTGVAVIEAALLIEAGWASEVDELWLTTAPREIIYKRLEKRSGMSHNEALARIKAQMPVSRQRRYATRVIDTDTTMDKLKSKVERAWRQATANLNTK